MADFGLSGKKRSAGLLGTPYWMAPELLHGEQPSAASDVYAFGITMYEILTRSEPYEGEDPMDVLTKVADLSLDPPLRPQLPQGCVSELRDLFFECVHKNPLRRPTFPEIKSRLEVVDVQKLQQLIDRTGGLHQKRRAEDLLDDIFPPKAGGRGQAAWQC